MEYNKRMIQELIQKIEDLPDDDEVTAVRDLIGILNTMLRIKAFTPPTIEIMMYIKHMKPNLYHATKKRISASSNLTILFQLEADFELVRERLKDYNVSCSLSLSNGSYL